MSFGGVIQGALALIVVLGVLVFIHELGHFLAAKLFRVRVEVFSLGFGPRLVGFRRGDTDYRIAPIPLGGYVRMSGEFGQDTEAPATDDKGLLTAKPRWQRMIIMLAGPAMNVALALVVWWGLFVHGVVMPDVPEGPPRVESLELASPALAAGLKSGDRIVAVGGKPVRSVDDYQNIVWFTPGQTLDYTIERSGSTMVLPVAIATHPRFGIGVDGVRIVPMIVGQISPGLPAEKAGLKVGDRILEVNGRSPVDVDQTLDWIRKAPGATLELRVLRGETDLVLTVEAPPTTPPTPRIGASFGQSLKLVKLGFLDAAKASGRLAAQNATMLLRTVSKLLQRQIGLGVMSGPLEIARVSRDQAAEGLIPLLQLLAFISLQLGIFNLLPIPVLDGGHILILLFEGAIRRDLSPVLKERALQAGFVLLIAFGVLVIAMDLQKAWRSTTAVPPAATAPASSSPTPSPAR